MTNPTTEMETDIPELNSKAALAWRTLYRNNPLGIAKNVLGIPEKFLWDGVIEMMDSVMAHRKTAVQAGHAMSKDWTSGLLTVIWLLMHWGNGKVIVTAPTMKQVKDIIFKEIEVNYRRLRQHCPEFPREALTTNKLYFGPRCHALGMTTKEGTIEDGIGKSSSKFSGFHSPNMLIIISESQGIEPAIYKQIRGLMTSPNSRILEIGNPVLPFGDFFEHCTDPRHNYNVIHLPVMRSPNIVHNKEVIPGMASNAWLEEFQNDLGPEYMDDPEYQIRALARFPNQSAMAWIPLSKLQECVQKYRSLKSSSPDNLRVGGLDVAGEGDDETSFTVLEGVCVEKIYPFRKVLTPETVGWTKNLIMQQEVEGFAVDYGYDPGVTNYLMHDKMPIAKVLFGEKSPSDKFSNFGTYIWSLFREAVMNVGVGLPNDPILISQLSSRRIEPQPDGKLRLQSKKKAGGKSFDRADSTVLAWYMRLLLLTGGDIESASNAAYNLTREVERHEMTRARKSGSGRKNNDEEDMEDVGIIGESRLEADEIDF